MSFRTVPRRYGKLCTVYGCRNRASNSPCRFHRFPCNIERLKMWVIKTGRYDLMYLLNDKNPKIILDKGGYVICSQHFSDTAYNCPAQRETSSLRHDAIPSENLPYEITSESCRLPDNQANFDVFSVCKIESIICDDGSLDVKAEDEVDSTCVDTGFDFPDDDPPDAKPRFAAVSTSETNCVPPPDTKLEVTAVSTCDVQVQTDLDLHCHCKRDKNIFRSRLWRSRQRVERLKEKLAAALKSSSTPKGFQNLSESQAHFVSAQLQNTSRKKRGRRYSDLLMRDCLEIYTASPAAYRILESKYMVPSRSVLRKHAICGQNVPSLEYHGANEECIDETYDL